MSYITYTCLADTISSHSPAALAHVVHHVHCSRCHLLKTISTGTVACRASRTRVSLTPSPASLQRHWRMSYITYTCLADTISSQSPAALAHVVHHVHVSR